MNENQTVIVPVDNLHPNPNNPRIEAGDVTELASSIKENGILQDILVVPAPYFGEDHYLIEDGYRRWVAARHIPLETVRVSVRTPGPDENLAIHAIVTSLVTTLHRADLTAMEKAKAYGRLRDEAGMTQQQIAKLMGLKSDGSVSRFLSLLELSPKYQEAISTGKASVDRALEAVVRSRAKVRKQKGAKPALVEWEPEHFTGNHHLARKAREMCDARDHNHRRRYGKIACGQCWETVIRQDQNTVDRVEYKNLGFDVPFQPPIMTASNDTNHKG